MPRSRLLGSDSTVVTILGIQGPAKTRGYVRGVGKRKPDTEVFRQDFVDGGSQC